MTDTNIPHHTHTHKYTHAHTPLHARHFHLHTLLYALSLFTISRILAQTNTRLILPSSIRLNVLLLTVSLLSPFSLSLTKTHAHTRVHTHTHQKAQADTSPHTHTLSFPLYSSQISRSRNSSIFFWLHKFAKNEK